jgi:hypothetical protein
MHSIIIQRQEDWPSNPGWWRYSRPEHQVVAVVPPISESRRWRYGSVEAAVQDQIEWDREHPRG